MNGVILMSKNIKVVRVPDEIILNEEPIQEIEVFHNSNFYEELDKQFSGLGFIKHTDKEITIDKDDIDEY